MPDSSSFDDLNAWLEETPGTGETRELADVERAGTDSSSSSPGGKPAWIGSFRIERVLGEGGMGIVYQGWDPALERAVAIKVIQPDCARDILFIERFRTEARAIARLSHPHIISVYTFAEKGDNAPYLVMEYVEGTDCDSAMRMSGPMKPERALKVIREAAMGLGHAAANNLIHRDVKPSNLIVSREGVTKVMDFGMSKLLDSDSGLTSTGSIMGTPNYMSPEQAKGDRADFKSDIYSLGCTLFTLLTAQRPYKSETMAGLLHKHVNEPLSIPKDWRGLYGGRLVALIERMTAKDPVGRHSSWDEVVYEIDEMLDGGEKVKPLRRPKKPKAAGKSGGGTRVSIAALVALVLLVAAGAGGWVAISSGLFERKSSTPPPSSTNLALVPQAESTTGQDSSPNPRRVVEEIARTGQSVRDQHRQGELDSRRAIGDLLRQGKLKQANVIVRAELRKPRPPHEQRDWRDMARLLHVMLPYADRVIAQAGTSDPGVDQLCDSAKAMLSDGTVARTSVDKWALILLLYMLEDSDAPVLDARFDATLSPQERASLKGNSLETVREFLKPQFEDLEFDPRAKAQLPGSPANMANP